MQGTCKKYLNEDIENDYKPSKEDEDKQKEIEALRIVLTYAQSYFEECMSSVTPDSNKARDAVQKDGVRMLLEHSA